MLRRTADDDDTTVEGRQERVVVANADQLVIVSALADPPPRTGFIDRCLVAAYDADIEPLLCLTKADLAGPDEAARLLRRAGPAVRAVPARTDPLDGARGGAERPAVGPRRPLRRGQVHAGQPARSGRRPRGRRGQRHRQGPAHLDQRGRPARCPAGGWIIDTPGVRSFGLAHVDPDSLLHGFPDLVEATANCPPNCDHTGAGGECGLDALVAAGGADGAGSPRTAGCSPPVPARPTPNHPATTTTPLKIRAIMN